MQKFCQECGAKAAADQKFCLSCGQPLQQGESAAAPPPPPPPAPKRKRTKKEKAVIASVLTVLVLLGGGIYGTSLYFSADQTAERFTQAFKDGDTEAVQKYVLHEDGTSINEFEAEALIALDEETALSSFHEATPEEAKLFTITEQKPLLGVIKKYAVTGADQHIELPLPDESVQAEVKLNGKVLSKTADSGVLTAGPLAPGVYTMTTDFSNDFGELSDEQELTLVSLSGTVQAVGAKIEFAEVSFNLKNGSPAHTKLNIDENEVAFGENGKTDTIGPIPIGSSLMATASAIYPWGEFSSEEMEISAGQNEIEVGILSDEQADQLLNDYLQYSEDLIKAMAYLDADHFTGISSDHQQMLAEQIIALTNEGTAVSGQVEVAAIHLDQATVTGEGENVRLSMPAEVMAYISLDHGKKELTYFGCELELQYVEDSFQVNKCDLNEISSVRGSIHEIKGTNTYFETVVEKPAEPVEPAEQPAAEGLNFNTVSRSEVESFMRTYNMLSVEAINKQDFSIIAPFTDSSGARYNEQRDYIDYLASKGITEEVDRTNLIDLRVVSATEAVVTTEEWFYIFQDGETRYNGYRTESVLKIIDGQFKLHELLKTDLIGD
ncbi:zinc ribbon domain-containing protein [Jeotgalibacillus malaysiensis]|uniref:zinc ribbon domain-containing protein n=1 Tax=Jeotgalibacillus malaysiensis TaxID=1508404 RepID=UPI00384ED4C0